MVLSGLHSVALARQPILDRTGALVAYELLFRRIGDVTAVIDDRESATAHVINNAFVEIGLANVLGSYQGFLNVDAGFVLSDYVSLLPAETVVLELLEDIEVSDALVARCRELRAEGFRLALDDYDGSRPDLADLMKLADIIKVDLMLVPDGELRALVHSLRRPGRLLLAEKVETQAQHRRCMSLGFDLFQGYFFARPEMLSARRPPASRVALLRLLTMLMTDAETGLLESEFKHHPDLSVNLLRLVNSAAHGIRGTISSMRQAIVMLGRRRLQAWLQLIVHTTSQSRGGIPLLHMASVRGRLLELIAQQRRPEDGEFHDLAFLTGIFSLMDVLLEMPMDAIVAQINPAETIREALLTRSGELGQMLTLAEQLEARDQSADSGVIAGVPDDVTTKLLRYQLEAFQWANAVSATAIASGKPATR